MIVTCPSCNTRYSLDPGSLGPRGRTVRCARCAHTWTQPPPADLPRIAEPAPLVLTPDTEEPPVVRARTRPGVALGLVVVILIGVVAGALGGRERIVARWPESKAWYQAVGISVNLPLDGLEIVAHMKRLSESGVGVIVVSGDVFNTSDRSVAVPRLRGVFRDAAKQELASWTFRPAGDRLLPGGSIPFSDRYENPPEGAVDLVVVFDTTH